MALLQVLLGALERVQLGLRPAHLLRHPPAQLIADRRDQGGADRVLPDGTVPAGACRVKWSKLKRRNGVSLSGVLWGRACSVHTDRRETEISGSILTYKTRVYAILCVVRSPNARRYER